MNYWEDWPLWLFTDRLRRELERRMQRHDECPECGGPRAELTIAPGRFFCPACEVAGIGPAAPRAGAQLVLGAG